MNNINDVESQKLSFTTTRIDELRTFLSKHYVKIDVKKAKQQPSINCEINIFRLPNTCISHLKHVPSIVMKMQEDQTRYNLSLSSKGSFELQMGKHTLCGSKSVGTLSSPAYAKQIRLGMNSSRYNISFNQSAMVEMLEQLLGNTISRQLEFDPRVDLNSNLGQQLNVLFNQYIESLKEAMGCRNHGAISSQFEQLILTILLNQQPHNYTTALEKYKPFTTSSDVKRVLTYIHEHLSQALTLTELIKISGVPGRTLFAHFRQFMGKTPLQYITEQRLTYIRQDLLNANQNENVTEIAMRWGFTQLGRFSGLYKRTYGELPRETLKKCRRKRNTFMLN